MTFGQNKKFIAEYKSARSDGSKYIYITNVGESLQGKTSLKISTEKKVDRTKLKTVYSLQKQSLQWSK